MNAGVDLAGRHTPPGVQPSFPSAAVLHGAALRDIIAERVAQVDRHGYTLAHDQQHSPDELTAAACCYAATADDQLTGAGDYDPAEAPAEWPWEPASWRCRDPRANLVKAAALLWAAIDRLDHAPRDAGDAPMVATDIPY